MLIRTCHRAGDAPDVAVAAAAAESRERVVQYLFAARRVQSLTSVVAVRRRKMCAKFWRAREKAARFRGEGIDGVRDKRRESGRN